jgi:Raf kinase inhibitor-like YbhB/YbcL family protein
MRTPIILFISTLSAGALADTAGKLEVTSQAFAEGESIPSEFTCDSTQSSPPLAWSGIPKDTKSVAILVEDPDAPKGTVTHWLVTGLSPTTTSLDAAAPLPAGAIAGKNEKGVAGYMGPCPPTGRHHYHFRVFALDATLTAKTRATFLPAITGHVLASGELVGTYEKQARH